MTGLLLVGAGVLIGVIVGAVLVGAAIHGKVSDDLQARHRAEIERWPS